MTVRLTGPDVLAPAPRRYLMCPPDYFDVTYAINPWMDPAVPVDRRRALRQWEDLAATYERLGHEVVVAAAEPGLPDMVFAANGGFVVDDVAIGVRFASAERAPEARRYREHLAALGYDPVHEPSYVNEGEGDLLLVGDVILAGTGFRTDRRAHDEVSRLTRREVVSLTLTDPRYYHLDTALAVLDDGMVAYLPDAFDAASRRELARRFPHALHASPGDAAVLGLNAVSDGINVVLPVEAETLAADLDACGYLPVLVDISELRKAGGGAKCCTLELHGARSVVAASAVAQLVEEVPA